MYPNLIQFRFHSGEGQCITTITFSQLKTRVARTASALRACGVGVGDRVVGYLPNSSVAIEAMLAVSSIGAIWSSTAPDFGVSVCGKDPCLLCVFMHA